MRAAGMEVPEQSLRGSSYMAEAGVNYQLRQTARGALT